MNQPKNTINSAKATKINSTKIRVPRKQSKTGSSTKIDPFWTDEPENLKNPTEKSKNSSKSSTSQYRKLPYQHSNKNFTEITCEEEQCGAQFNLHDNYINHLKSSHPEIYFKNIDKKSEYDENCDINAENGVDLNLESNRQHFRYLFDMYRMV